jgi:hypothetical protein
MSAGNGMGARFAAIAAILALAAAPAPARAQTKVGPTLGQFLLIEPSARVAGMGNAGVSLLDGLDAVYYNPAAIGESEGGDVLFSHSEWLAGIRYDYVAAAIPGGRLGNFYATVTSLNSGEMEVRTVADPHGTGELFSVSDVAIGLGFGRAITNRFSAGVQLNYVQETVWHNSYGTATLSFGTLYRVSEHGLHIGSSLSHFGTQARFDGRDLRFTYDNDPDISGDNSALPGLRQTDNFPMPVLFRVGVGMPYRFGPETEMRLALDAYHPSDNTESVSAGVELGLKRMLALRVGYQNAFQQDSEVGLTAGGGVRGRVGDYAYRVDYAWADHGRLGSAQRFTLGVTF